MAEWFSTPDSTGQFQIAGYNEFGGDWQDVEKGADALEVLTGGTDDTGERLAEVERVTVHLITESGDDVYYTLHGPFAGWDDVAEAVDDASDVYGG